MPRGGDPHRPWHAFMIRTAPYPPTPPWVARGAAASPAPTARGGDAAGGGLFLDSGTVGRHRRRALHAKAASGGPGAAMVPAAARAGAGTGGGSRSFALDLDIGPDFASGTFSGFELQYRRRRRRRCTSATGGAGGHGAGGGLFIGGGAASLGDVSLIYNLASGAPGAPKVGVDGGAGEGGGIFSDVNADLTVQNTHFVENAAGGGLGGSGGDLRHQRPGRPGVWGRGLRRRGGVGLRHDPGRHHLHAATRPPAAAPRSATAAPARAGRSSWPAPHLAAPPQRPEYPIPAEPGPRRRRGSCAGGRRR